MSTQPCFLRVGKVRINVANIESYYPDGPSSTSLWMVASGGDDGEGTVRVPLPVEEFDVLLHQLGVARVVGVA